MKKYTMGEKEFECKPRCEFPKIEGVTFNCDKCIKHLMIKLTAEEFVFWVSRNKCPLCQKKIYITANKKMGYCKSKQKDKFTITGKTLLALGGSLA